jgi:hypothetical protein
MKWSRLSSAARTGAWRHMAKLFSVFGFAFTTSAELYSLSARIAIADIVTAAGSVAKAHN